MEKRLLFLKIQLCPGFGRAACSKIGAYYYQHPQAALNFAQLVKIGQLTPSNQKHAVQAWSSAALAKNLAWHSQLNFFTYIDSTYPVYLRESYQPPLVLFYQGHLALLKQPILTIVGARQAGTYTQAVLNQFIPSLVNAEVVIASGLAAGADRMAHLTTLAAKGQTIAVIGTGLNRYYPAANQALQARIASVGLVLSEYPLNSPPQRHHFPERNRILAGLCQALCVTEARQHSGSLITANLALQANRNVLAVPGAITRPLSAGCNQLIAAGARPALTVQDLLEELPIR